MMRVVVFLSAFIVCKAFYVIIPTGNVGVKTNLGVIQKSILYPGFHLYTPWWSDVEIFDTKSQTDTLSNIVCKTKDKQEVLFPEIQIMNQLPAEHVYNIYLHYHKPTVNYDRPLLLDPAQIFIKEHCSKITGEQLRTDYADLNDILTDHLVNLQLDRPELEGKATGVKILRVFVDIPMFSKEVEKNYQEISIQNTAKQAEFFRQETEMKKKETENLLAQREAEKLMIVAATENKQRIEKEEADAKVAKIQAESLAEQMRIKADAEFYANQKKAEVNKNLLTDEYLLKLQVESFGCQNVIHYGNLPSFLPDPKAAKVKDI